MILDQSTLSKIRNYGALKYTAERICTLLAIDGEERDAFQREWNDPMSQVRKYYNQGVAIGEYNADAELAKLGEKGDVIAISELHRIQHKRKIDQTRLDLFGV
ncbi:MAG: hypothetical protein V2A67_04465 [Bacteroidota bacterium]